MRGSVYRTTAGSWGFVHNLPSTASNPRPQRRKQGFKDEDTAWAAMRASIREAETGGVDPGKLTVGEFLDLWLDRHVRKKAGTTAERWGEIVRLYLKPNLGHIKIKVLSPLQIEDYYLTVRRADGKGVLSSRTILQHHRILHRALNHAIQWRILQNNPADAVEPPSFERKEQRVLGFDDTIKLLDYFAEGPAAALFIPVLIAIATGARRGEALGLLWRDINFEIGTIAIRRSVEQTRQGIRLKPTKESKQNAVQVGPEVLQILAVHRQQQASVLGERGPDDLVSCGPGGRMIIPDNFSKSFAWHIRKSPVPTVRFQDLRHGHVTHLSALGVEIKTISQRVNHSSAAFTMDYYGHVLPAAKQDSAELLDNRLFRNTKGKKGQN